MPTFPSSLPFPEMQSLLTGDEYAIPIVWRRRLAQRRDALTIYAMERGKAEFLRLWLQFVKQPLRSLPVARPVCKKHCFVPLREIRKVRGGRQRFTPQQREDCLWPVAPDDPHEVELDRGEIGQFLPKCAAHSDWNFVIFGEPFDPRSKVDRVADQRIRKALRRTHVADAAWATVETDPDCNLARPGLTRLPPHFRIELFKPPKHGERRTGRIGVLVRSEERRVPEGENGIADELVDRGLARQQDVAHRRKEADQEADDRSRIEFLGN